MMIVMMMMMMMMMTTTTMMMMSILRDYVVSFLLHRYYLPVVPRLLHHGWGLMIRALGSDFL
jgi:hypothetical protein